MHKLILLLGTGQGTLKKELDQDYKKTDYYFEENPDDICSTPFVGEAIIRKSNIKFDKVYILGTEDSMWETLFLRVAEESKYESDEEILGKLIDEKSSGKLSENSEVFKNLCARLFGYYGVRTECKIINVGLNHEERWGIFKTMLDIIGENDKVSIDITHGLRYQPFILTLAMFYTQSIKNTKLENVFYGALELTRKYFNNKTPIFNLKSFADMAGWVNAASAFTKFGDITGFAELMKEKGNIEFARRAEYFFNAIQLNSVAQIKNSSVYFNNEIKNLNLNSGEKKAFNLVKKELLEFPEKLSKSMSNWELMLLVAEKHWQNKNLGLSILAAWEALMERVSAVNNINIRNNIENFREVSIILRKNPKTKKLANKIADLRNSIAHSDAESGKSVVNIMEKYPTYLRELRELLFSDDIIFKYS